MCKKEILIDQNVVNYIQKLQYEYESRKDVIIHILSNNLPVGDIFIQYQKDYEKSFEAYLLAKDNLTATYIPKDLKNVSWVLDFYTNILEISYEE
jgi:hypothetical protein